MGNSLIGSYFSRSKSDAIMLQIAKDELAAGHKDDSSDNADVPKTFMQRLLANQKQNPTSLTDRDIMTHSFNNIAAGSETTATALRGIIYHCLRTPRAHERLVKEVRECFTEPNSHVTFAVANKLPYLSAVIKEGIRLHPSVGLMLVRVVPKTGATICGHSLKAGVEVGINPWIVQRDPTVFDEPDEFYPERWLPTHNSEEKIKQMNRSWIPFGHGAHTCSGRWTSWLEIYVVIATLFLHYDMELVDGGKDFTFHNLWFTQQTGLYCTMERAPRNQATQGRAS